MKRISSYLRRLAAIWNHQNPHRDIVEKNMDSMKKKYQSEEEIEQELKSFGIENFVEFNANDEYVFGKYEKWEGPLIGHMEVKCRGEMWDME